MSYYLGIRLNNLKYLSFERMRAQSKLWSEPEQNIANKTKQNKMEGFLHSTLLSERLRLIGPRPCTPNSVPNHSQRLSPPQTRSFLFVGFRFLGTRQSHWNLRVFSLAHLSVGNFFSGTFTSFYLFFLTLFRSSVRFRPK